MKILQINKLYYPWVGGIERVVKQLSEGLTKSGEKVDVLCSVDKGKDKVEEINQVKIFRTSSLGIFASTPLSVSFFKVFKQIRNDYDIIDIHHPSPLAFLALFCFKTKGKIIIHYHSDIVKQKFLNVLFKPFVIYALKQAKKIIISNPNLIFSSDILLRFKDKCEVIPFGIDLDKLKSNFDEDLQLEIKEKYGDFVLFAGRINYYKGIEYLIKAVKDLKNNLVLIGEGQEKQKLIKLAKELGVEEKVFFLEHQTRKKLINYFKTAKVFVLPSIHQSETFGIVLLEAMACGTPVVSTELGTGTSFVNQNGETGFVVPARDAKALEKAINRILNNKNINFKTNCLNRVKNGFLLENFIKKTQEVYENI